MCKTFRCKYKPLSLVLTAYFPSEIMQPALPFSLQDSLKKGKIILASVINTYGTSKWGAGRCMWTRQWQPGQAGQKQKQKDTNHGTKEVKAR